MKKFWKGFRTTAVIVILPLVLTHCLITKVQQPASAAKGVQITVTVTMKDDQLPSTNPDKGVLCAMVPSDWSFVSGTYTAQLKNGTPVGTGNVLLSTAWADSATRILPPTAGMKWIGMLSDTGYVYADTLFVDAVIKFMVGQTAGTFQLGYLCTKNNGGLIDQFAAGWSDTSMGNKIVVGTSGVELTSLGTLPSSFGLSQNYPNPFNPSTQISFSLKERSDVRLAVYDLAGREVAVLAEGPMEAGVYRIRFAPEGMASGMYLYRLVTGTFTESHKMLLLK